MKNEYQTNKSKRRPRRTVANLFKVFDIQNYIGWDNINRHLPFALFLGALAIIYIWNKHQSERNIRALNKTEKELIELKWYYNTAKDELTRKSRQSQVAKLAEEQGIKELTEPPKIIVIE